MMLVMMTIMVVLIFHDHDNHSLDCRLLNKLYFSCHYRNWMQYLKEIQILFLSSFEKQIFFTCPSLSSGRSCTEKKQIVIYTH